MITPTAVHERTGSQRTCMVTKTLHEMPESDRVAWQKWIDTHGIRAIDVLLGSPITCDDEQRTITYTAPELNDLGRWARDEGGLITRQAVVQLDAPAALMPGETP